MDLDKPYQTERLRDIFFTFMTTKKTYLENDFLTNKKIDEKWKKWILYYVRDDEISTAKKEN